MRYTAAMDGQQTPEFYKSLIDQASSYHELVVLRSRFFGLIDRSLSKEDSLAVRDHWNARAKDETLPIAPQ